MNCIGESAWLESVFGSECEAEECFLSPIRQAKPALELNSVWASCLVTPLAENGKKVSQLNASITVDVGAAGHLGGGDDNPLAAIWNCIAYEALDA